MDRTRSTLTVDYSALSGRVTRRTEVKFLDYAADRIFLRKVGGGYMFIHRMLLEHFAARYAEPGTMPKKDLSSGEQLPA